MPIFPPPGPAPTLGSRRPSWRLAWPCAFNGLVGAIVLEVVNSGALSRPIDVLTFCRLLSDRPAFGGEAGAAFLGHFISMREQFHSNILGLGVDLGDLATRQRLLGLSAAMRSQSSGLTTATGRAAEILGLQVRQQAFTLAITDSFLLVAWASVCCLLVVACMAQVPKQYRQVVSS